MITPTGEPDVLSVRRADGAVCRVQRHTMARVWLLHNGVLSDQDTGSVVIETTGNTAEPTAFVHVTDNWQSNATTPDWMSNYSGTPQNIRLGVWYTVDGNSIRETNPETVHTFSSERKHTKHKIGTELESRCARILQPETDIETYTRLRVGLAFHCMNLHSLLVQASALPTAPQKTQC